MVQIKLAGILFTLDLLHDSNKKRFERFMAAQAGGVKWDTLSEQDQGIPDHRLCKNGILDQEKNPAVIQKKEEYVSWRDILFNEISREDLQKDPMCEFQYILLPVSDRLLKYGRCIIHGTAFQWNGSGFIFMGPSGIGKSTQYRNWKRKYGEEVMILNGDKPVLERRKGDRYYIRPSSWRGKENWASMASAGLGGIILLEQAPCNEICLLNPSEAAVPVLQQLFYSVENTDLIRKAVSFVRGILETVPVWKLRNTGDVNSAVLTHDTLTAYFERCHPES